MARLRGSKRQEIERPLPVEPERFEAIGQSEAFLDFQESLARVAPVDRPVLLIGERGTGKEMAARRLHFLSRRWGQPFVTLHCAALSPTLIESELFGHETGAFTGATHRRIGRFEAADGGTLFLDEISLIPVETQEKILRVVEYGTFERVGSTDPTQADARIIGASNADLLRLAEAGEFKQDLLDRLSFEVLFVPPLRERKEDILVLANHFTSRMAFQLGHDTIPEFSEQAVQALLAHPWPGNVRELKNVAERAVYRSDREHITRVDFDPFRSPYAPAAPQPAAPPPESTAPEEQAPAPADEPEDEALPAGLATVADTGSVSLPSALKAVELHFLRRALKLARYNQRVASEALGLTYNQFRRLYRKYADELKGPM